MNEIKKINVDGVDYDIVAKELTKTTYAELKALRDNGQLSEGHLYRITDYVTTTTETNTKSAGNVFDVIVLATSASELSHIARAIQHEGDTYFDGNDLGAWELWYDLDNDTEKYEWADATNGKGVIYRMIDEKRNDCPYDFKNILFYTTKYGTGTAPHDKYYFTFSYVVSGVLYDGTAESQVSSCHGNKMGAYITNEKKSLNIIVFRNTSFISSCLNNNFGAGCYNNFFGNTCSDNTFDCECNNNTFGENCHNNTFGYNCTGNTLGNNCYYNKFGVFCQDNKFGNYCYNNTFDCNCLVNKFSNSCQNNTFGHECRYNNFNMGCCYNNFGDSSGYNTFSDYCIGNTIGNTCMHNIFDNYCSYNTLSSYCNSRHLYNNKTSIALNDEYYDDGSGQLVPIKHPDLSTQPSILPYKFMGQYVYEQLIPAAAFNNNSFNVDILSVPHDKILFLEISSVNGGAPRYAYSLFANYNFDGNTYYTLRRGDGNPLGIDFSYLRVVYTSMPEEGGYYGYNNY